MPSEARNDVAEREVFHRRTYDAPARIVFLAFTTAEHLQKWWGPKPYPVTHCELEFKVGGKIRYAMTGPDGVRTPFSAGEFLVIEPNQRIMWSQTFEGSGVAPMTVDVTFVEKNGKTELTVHSIFPTVQVKGEHVKMGFEQGLGMGLDQLRDVVKELA
jgi:uncharacterized protein YndB with AHSA1/START domain